MQTHLCLGKSLMNIVKAVRFVLFSILLIFTVHACQSTTDTSKTAGDTAHKTSTTTESTAKTPPPPPANEVKNHQPQIVLPPSITPKNDKVITLKELPAEAKTTLELIKNKGTFPYPKKDGSEFKNLEKRLPKQKAGYYKEYTVPTPNVSNRGTRRIVVGEAGEMYYTDDHYKTFRLISIK